MEIMQLLGNLDVRKFLIIRLSWICRINRMDSKRHESKVFNNNPPGSRLRGRPNKRWQNCVKTHINSYKIRNRKESSKNGADWKEFIEDWKVRIELQWHLRKRRKTNTKRTKTRRRYKQL